MNFVDHMVRLLAHGSDDQRYAAVRFFASQPVKGAVDDLNRALKDPSADVRFWAAVGLGRLKDPSALTSLCHALVSDGEPEVREAVCEALGEIGDDRAAAPLLAALEDEHSSVAAAARAALVRLGSPAVEALIDCVRDARGFQDRRQRAIAALGEIGDARACDALMGILRNRDEHVDTRQEAADALDRIDAPEWREELDYLIQCLSYWQDDSPFKGPPPEPPKGAD